MSTDTLTQTRSPIRVTQWRVIKAEWIKFFSLRSNRIATVAAMVAVFAFGILTASVASGSIVPESRNGSETPDFTSFLDHTAIATSGMMLAILIVGSLGVLAFSGEYSSGMIRATAAAVPKRLPFLWGKALVLTVVAAVTMAVAVFGTFAITGNILADSGFAADLGDPNVFRALIGNVGYVVGIGLLGVSLGVLLRSTAGGISTLFGVLLILPQLINLILPDNIAEVVYKFWPSTAAESFIVTDPSYAFGAQGQELLTPGAGALVLLVWVALFITVTAVSLKRRDA
jgi:ABC-type transport system involved in multi-copper enzyme maturation permease subunit